MSLSRWQAKGVGYRVIEELGHDVDLEKLHPDSTVVHLRQHGVGDPKAVRKRSGAGAVG